MGKDMWEYDKKLKAWYWDDDGFIISICQRKNSPKYEVWVMGGANLIDTKIVNSIEEGKKWAKKKWLTD
jgi:hypothetical protein